MMWEWDVGLKRNIAYALYILKRKPPFKLNVLKVQSLMPMKLQLYLYLASVEFTKPRCCGTGLDFSYGASIFTDCYQYRN